MFKIYQANRNNKYIKSYFLCICRVFLSRAHTTFFSFHVFSTISFVFVAWQTNFKHIFMSPLCSMAARRFTLLVALGDAVLAGAAALFYFSNVPKEPRLLRPRARPATLNWPCVRR